MKSSVLMTIAIFTIVLLAIELYVFKGVSTLTKQLHSPGFRLIIHLLYWAVTIGLMCCLLYVFVTVRANGSPVNNKLLSYVMGAFILITVPKLVFFVFHLLDDITTGVSWLISSATASPATSPHGNAAISRSAFLTKVGLGVASIPFIAIGYGILKGRYDYRVRRHTLEFDNLPKSFDGFKVVQISDIHIGSFFDNHQVVQKGIDMVLDLKPDLIVFTGDLVNNLASETDGWAPVLSQLKAPMGVFSILGNHDYGDYMQWDSLEQKQANLTKLLRVQREELGMDLLLNEHRILEKGGEHIALIGVENWGKPPFVQHGQLDKAMAGTDNSGFQLLLSHDPSHWEAQVLNHTKIDLTLSGHTHGMQFGIEIPGIKWSPVQYRYPRWGGLYAEGNQRLYVNRGFGYIGFPGRVGILPEITLLELKCSELA